MWHCGQGCVDVALMPFVRQFVAVDAEHPRGLGDGDALSAVFRMRKGVALFLAQLFLAHMRPPQRTPDPLECDRFRWNHFVIPTKA